MWDRARRSRKLWVLLSLIPLCIVSFIFVGVGEGGHAHNSKDLDALSYRNPFGLPPLTITSVVGAGDHVYITPLILENFLKKPILVISVEPFGVRGRISTIKQFQLNGCESRPPLVLDYSPSQMRRLYPLRAAEPFWLPPGQVQNSQCRGYWFWFDELVFPVPEHVVVGGLWATYEVDGEKYRDVLPIDSFDFTVLRPCRTKSERRCA